jgi:hypothetical protein
MKFYQRLAYYLFGVMIGGIFVYYMIGGKDTGCSYFPNARVLKDIRRKPVAYSDSAQMQMAVMKIDTSDVRKIMTYGDVDFSRSNKPTDGGKLYIVEGRNKQNEPIEVAVVNGSERVLIKSFTKIK